MNDYLLLMHDDAPAGAGDRSAEAWGAYIQKLRAAGVFEGGSEIGSGVTVSKGGVPRAVTRSLSGFIRVRAESMERARALIEGNPLYEAGGTVEIRELPKS